MSGKRIAYWTTTGILVFFMFTGGVAELAQVRGNLEGMRALGYPGYVMGIIGFWKVLACVALLAPGLPRVKEWAYAGIFFNMTGAAASHVLARSEVWHVPVTLAFAALALASWALRPPGRTLGAQRQHDAERVRGRA